MNMYVSNLGFHVTDEDLKKLFAGYGEVTSAKVITDKISGKSRGFGFVEMPVEAAAQQAMQELEGIEVEGRTISVSIAKPRSEGSNRSFSGGSRESKW
jgi:RNA recognition motif-containing protein